MRVIALAGTGDDAAAVAVLRSLVIHGRMPTEAPLESSHRRCADTDRKTRAMVVVAAVVATGGGPSSYRGCVDAAIAAGASAEEIVDVLVDVAPIIGLACLASATTELAAALGYSIDHAFEALDPPST